MHSTSIFVVFALTFSCALAYGVETDEEWNLWKKTYNKQYSRSGELTRRLIWEQNLRTVKEHNLEADRGTYTYWLGMNQYADKTVNEFSSLMKTYYSMNEGKRGQTRSIFTYDPNLKVPDTVDWRDKGYVTPVKNQGQCEACWAFAALGAIEGQYFNATGKLVSFAAQQLVDCAGEEGGLGCVGGFAYNGFDYAKAVGGVEAEDSYPYEDDDNKCRFDVTKALAKVTGYTNITSKDENALQQAVATIGPITVAIDSSHPSFQLYKSGIYHQLFCSEKVLDRSLLVVGYGIDSGKDYWLVKNSWGTEWGEQGYIRMTRNKHNECGIATAASYPIVSKF
jgi:cathepsin L